MEELDQGTTEQEICQGHVDRDNYPEEWKEVDNRRSNKMQKTNDYDNGGGDGKCPILADDSSDDEYEDSSDEEDGDQQHQQQPILMLQKQIQI